MTSTKKFLLGKEVIPISTLQEWSDKRLLRYYRTYRKTLLDNSPHSDDDENEIKKWNDFKSYLEEIKSVLNTRKHVA